MTAAAALDAGRVHPSEVIWCENGSYVVAKHRFKEDRLPFGNLTFTEVLAKSSNVGAIKVAQRLRPEEFLSYIKELGFGRKTGLDYPGESPGMLRDVSGWSGLSQASMAMGQEIGVTTLQLAAMMGAIANDGVWMRPRLVQEMLQAPGGRVARPFPDDGIPDGADLGARTGETPASPEDRSAAGPGNHRAVSETTARTLRAMLQTVTVDGTGKAAAVPGYTVGGKTGTAQKIDASGHYARDKHVSWFAGFVPVGHPALAIVVMIDEPQGPKFHGGDVAAPVFARIAGPTLMYLKVPPDHEDPLVFDRSVQASLAPVEDDPPRDTKTRGASIRGGARPPRVVAAVKRGRPGPGGTAETDRDADLLTASLASLPGLGGERGGTGLMPDLDGLSLRQASEALAAIGLACRTDKRGGKVTRQDPPAGTAVGPATPCAVTY